jgi:serine/threonine protein kinase
MELKEHQSKKLSLSSKNIVIALNDKEVAKIFNKNTRSDIGSEAEKMRFANAINALVVQFIRLDISEVNDAEMLVMERIFPMDYRAFEYEKRELMLDVFQDEIEQLHRKGFVHRDLQRPSNMPGMAYDNIFLTEKGLRLIDTGISALQHQVGDRLFERYIKQELEELERFKIHFLNQ